MSLDSLPSVAFRNCVYGISIKSSNSSSTSLMRKFFCYASHLPTKAFYISIKIPWCSPSISQWRLALVNSAHISWKLMVQHFLNILLRARSNISVVLLRFILFCFVEHYDFFYIWALTLVSPVSKRFRFLPVTFPAQALYLQWNI